MKRPHILQKLLQTLVITLALCFSVAWAQQSETGSQSTDPQGPIQPLASDGNQPLSTAIGGPIDQSDAQTEASAQVQPDTHALSGAETLGLGSLRRLRRIFDPALRFSEFGQTGIVAGKTLSTSSLGGSIDVGRNWSRYSLVASYNGAEVIDEPSYLGFHSLPYHDGSISQEIVLGHWALRLRDDVLYSRGAGFGSIFAGGPAQAGQNSSLNSIQPSLASTGTIQTALARQLSNSAVVEIDYSPSRRTTLTLLGSYGLLHFLDAGYISNQNINGRVGYNYALSGKNNIALTYDRNHITFSGATGRLQTDLVQLAFGRKVTGRLALQVAAGPQLLHFNYFGSAKRQQLSWSASGSLTYQWNRRTVYSLAYFRGVTAGSGVFIGSTAQTVTATANHEFTRVWSASVDGGYAMNNGLVSTAFFASRFDDWFAGASLNRQIGRQVHLDLSYGFQQQTSGGGTCPVLSCGLPGSFSQFGVTLQWHPLPVRAR